MTDTEKNIIRLHLVKAVLHLQFTTSNQVDAAYSREVASGATIFRIELLPELLKLVRNRKQYENRMMAALIKFWRSALGRVY
ncbi:hypothetical protein PMAYCL1PPCAC_13560, partial [Pristionchus mayeri]